MVDADTLYANARKFRAFMLVLRSKQRRQPLYTEAEIERALRSFLSANEPKTMRLLFSTWDAQRSAITQADLVRAAANGSLTPAVVARWQGQYADFVNNRLAPIWRAGGSTAAKFIEDQLQLNFPGYQSRFPKLLDRIDDWIKQRGGALITGLTDSQRQAVNAILRHYTVDVPLSANELAKVIRPVVGLTPREAQAVQRRRDDLIAQGFSPLKATEQAARYAATLNRVRANRIARTELATAFNQAQLGTIKQGIEDGDLLPDVQKKWVTAEDERVCPICRPLNRTHKDVEGDDTTFTSGKFSADAPPIHPSCRCTIVYVLDTDAQLQLTEQREETEEEDLMLSDDELRDFDSSTYGSVQSAVKPDGQRIDEDRLRDSLELISDIDRGRESYFLGDRAQANSRMQMNRLLSEFGVPNRDVLWSSGKPILLRDSQMEWATTGADRYKLSSLGRGTKAAHAYTGEIYCGRSSHNAAVRFLKGNRSKSAINGMAALVHENLHGASLFPIGLNGNRVADVLSEFTTESAARYIMKRKFGVDSDAGYSIMLGKVRRGFVRALASNGRTISIDDAADILNRASLLFKRADPSGYSDRSGVLLDKFIDSVPGLSDAERSDFRSEFFGALR